MFPDLMQGGKIDLQQHGDNHQPDQNRHRHIDLGDLHPADGMKGRGQEMPQGHAGNDAQGDP